jgi:hypothetical protein
LAGIIQAFHRKSGDVRKTDAASAINRGVVVLLAAGALAILACVAGLVVAVTGDHAAVVQSRATRAGNFDYVVHRIETTDVLADPEYPEHNITAAGEFVVVKLTATNISGDRQTFRTAFDTVSDGSAEYQVAEAAWRYVGEPLKAVDPGKSIEAAIVFDVPKGVDLDAIVLRDRRFAEGVAVAL